MDDRFRFRIVCRKVGMGVLNNWEIIDLDIWDFWKYGSNYEVKHIWQCTGLRDRAGRLIFEGDIVEIENWRREYQCEKCGYEASKKGYGLIAFQNLEVTDFGTSNVARFSIKILEKGIETAEYELHNTNNYEVIGNVYENPDLLEGK